MVVVAGEGVCDTCGNGRATCRMGRALRMHRDAHFPLPSNPHTRAPIAKPKRSIPCNHLPSHPPRRLTAIRRITQDGRAHWFLGREKIVPRRPREGHEEAGEQREEEAAADKEGRARGEGAVVGGGHGWGIVFLGGRAGEEGFDVRRGLGGAGYLVCVGADGGGRGRANK